MREAKGQCMKQANKMSLLNLDAKYFHPQLYLIDTVQQSIDEHYFKSVNYYTEQTEIVHHR